MRQFSDILSQNRFVQHSLFWLLSYLVLLDIFALSGGYEKTDYIYTFLFHFSLLLLVYVNVRWLFPNYFEKGKYLLFLLLGFILVCFSAYFNELTFNYLSDWLFAGYYFISYYEYTHLVQFMLVYFGISSLLKLSKSWFYLDKKEQAIQRLQKEKTDAELLALKSQVNPHFLFNSLNNIYALSLDGEKEVPDLILSLSDTMRYMLYECNGERVALERELVFLEDYVRLQEQRTDHKADIRFEIEGNSEGRQIAPLLLIPFIENGFKHGIKGAYEKAFIHIFIKIEKEKLRLQVRNNVGRSDENIMGETGGIGLDNVQKRLNLIYPSRYELEIISNGEHFEIKLAIKDVERHSNR